MSSLPPAARSRAARRLVGAAARGRFALPVCMRCGAVQYPPRDVCVRCLYERLQLRAVPEGGTLLAVTTVRVTTDPWFRARLPWRIGSVRLDSGPTAIAHLHGGCEAGARVRLELKLDRSGEAVLFALPAVETATMQDDRQLREFTQEPRGRNILVTDGSSALGRETARALALAGARQVWVGSGQSSPAFAPRAVPSAGATDLPNIMPLVLDAADPRQLQQCAAQIGAELDVVVNTADGFRAGGGLSPDGAALVRASFEAVVVGLANLAQAFGPALCARAADPAHGMPAWVNVLSIYACASRPEWGAYSAAHAAARSYLSCLRAQFGRAGVRVAEVLTGPLDDPAHSDQPPPLVRPGQVAAAVVELLRAGREEVVVGEVAQDLLARLADSPKALERELARGVP
ncbi:MAG: SDR family NAD(P)-dependent oxidoreductase [Proteobacteria bacterium]|nr:SDR family NAD(P)-dependent oxidoreductase [Pseudomonadota bacterium]